jgi:hypothetical protein
MHKVVPTPELTATVQEHLYWVCNQTLAFADEYSDVRFDARELADEIALAVNLSRFEARQRHQAFVHRASYLLAGDMVISAAAYVPLVAQGRLKVRHKAAGAGMLVPVLLGLLSSLGPAFCQY